MTAVGRPPARRSRTARLGFVVALLLLVYGSIFPARGWIDSGVSPFAWMQAPFPRYWTLPEIAWNVAVYVPVGLLLAWSLRPGMRGVLNVAVATAICALLSAGVESIQTFLPGRVASNVDFAANTAGAALGAFLGVLSAPRLVDARWRVHWGEHVLLPGTHPVIVLVGLWVLAQIPAQAMLFGTGDIASLLPGDTLRLEAWLPGLVDVSPTWRARAEQFCTALAVIGVGMMMLHCLRPFRLRVVLIPLLVILALSVKAMAQPLAPPGGPAAFVWFTPGALRGLALGAVGVFVLAAVPAVWQRRVAILALLGQLAIVNLFPADRYFLASVATGYTGLLYLEALLREVAVIWPWLALGWIVWSAGSRRVARLATP